MPVRENSNLKTVSVILTKEQDTEVRRIQSERSSDIRKVSYAEAMREIVAAGLAVYRHDRDMDIATSGTTRKAAA